MADKAEVMSEAVAIVYRQWLDDLKSAKQLQWTITNYLLLIYGGIFAVAKSFGHLSVCEEIIAEAGTFIALVCVLFLLVKIQYNIGKTRCDLSRIEAKEPINYFNSSERKMLELDKPSTCPDHFLRGWEFLFVLIGVSLVGFLLLAYSLWHGLV